MQFLKKCCFGILNIFLGLFTVFKHSFKKRITLEYPEKRKELNKNFRGKHYWNSDLCINCKLCTKVCPANAISITKNDENFEFIIDYKKCIFCGNCKFYCPKSAVSMSKDYELATDNKSELILKFNARAEVNNE